MVGVGLAKLEKKKQKLAELAELSDGDVEGPQSSKEVRGVPKKAVTMNAERTAVRYSGRGVVRFFR